MQLRLIPIFIFVLCQIRLLEHIMFFTVQENVLTSQLLKSYCIDSFNISYLF